MKTFAYRDGFTLIELVVVLAVIIVLAGLVLGTSSYVQKKGQRSRAEAEIAAMSAALESYKADNGIYPQSNALSPVTQIDAVNANKTDYEAASQVLYVALSGDSDRNRTIDAGEGKAYFAFKPNVLAPSGGQGTVTAILDPFRNSYGYSTMQASASTGGYNPTFDLWSTTNSSDPAQWVKNW